MTTKTFPGLRSEVKLNGTAKFCRQICVYAMCRQGDSCKILLNDNNVVNNVECYYEQYRQINSNTVPGSAANIEKKSRGLRFSLHRTQRRFDIKYTYVIHNVEDRRFLGERGRYHSQLVQS